MILFFITNTTYSIAPNGHFLTEDPFFSSETFEPPYFKKDTGKKVKKKQATLDEIEAPESADWTEHVKRVDITCYQQEDFRFYEKIVNQAFELYATEKIKPFVSQVYSLRDTIQQYKAQIFWFFVVQMGNNTAHGS